MDIYPERHEVTSSNTTQLRDQIMNQSYKDLNESHKQIPEGLTNSTFNMLKIIGSACTTCICNFIEYLKGLTAPTSDSHCDGKPCYGKDCTSSFNCLETADIEFRLRYKNKFRNEVDHVKMKNKARPYGDVRYCWDRTRSCRYMPSEHMPSRREGCKHNAFRRNALTVAHAMEDTGPPGNCRCSPCSCDHCTQRGLNMARNQTHDMSTGIHRRANCQCENCLDNSSRPNSTDDCKCSVRRGVFRKPTEKYIQDYDIHSARVENQPLIIKAKRLSRYNSVSIYDTRPCIRRSYQCRQQNAINDQMGFYNTAKLQELKPSDYGLCKCIQCECLACTYSKQTVYTGSMDSLRTCNMCYHTRNKWNERSKFDDFGHVSQLSKRGSIRVVENPANNIISEDRNSEKVFNHGPTTGYDDTHLRPFRCAKQNNLFHKTNFNELLDNVYSDLKVDDHENNPNQFSMVDLKRIPRGKIIYNNYEMGTLVNSETNTENHISNKCVETDCSFNGKKKYADNKVKNYEYILKIEIQVPNLYETNDATKQRIKKDTKKGIKEQTARVVRELFSDISKNSLFNENSPGNPETYTVEQRLKNMESSEQKVRSILKHKILTSKTGEAPSSITELPSSSKSNSTAYEDCYFLHFLTPRQHTLTELPEKVIEIHERNSPSKDDQTLSPINSLMSMENMQNEWTDNIFLAPANITTSPANSMKKLSIMNDAAMVARDLNNLRVQDPCVRRVSNHTVRLKWELPKLIEDVIGYEILVDGKVIGKIFNGTQCLAVVSCLPPVGRILITVRTITKTPALPGLFPCTTIGYRPKCIEYLSSGPRAQHS